VQLRVASRAENVAIVRAMLTGVADALQLPAELSDGVRTAVSEACNNVVLHAYEGGEGPLDVDVSVRRDALEVVVRDRGSGIRPHAHGSGPAVHGVGLAVVQAFTDRVELRGAEGAGTEVRMEFAAGQVLAATAGALGVDSVTAPPPPEPPANGAAVAILAPPLAGPVLAHLAAALAVRARFTVDRLADAQLVADAVAAHAPTMSPQGCLVVRLHTAPRTLELMVGPLLPDSGARLVSDSGAAGLEPVIARLTDDVRVQAGADGDLVRVRMDDRRRPTRPLG
jgi:serine/threonine-protein kinase RsbW